jgi:UDP-N-acetylmuramoyl-L-alanyl-D-glutamate--2,6-diaminopimelate ligase
MTIITEDNSRNEAFSDICSDIVAGIEPGHRAFEIIEERSLAIKRAVELSEPGDMVIIAGKGHEDYMEKNGERIAFSDAKEVKKYVRLCKYHH